MQTLISHFLNLVSYILIFNNHILIYISIMSNDGLSNTEKVNLLFKNYMNFTSTLDSKAFFEETALANNTNIFSTSVLSSTPSTSPNFNTTISNASDLSTLLVNAGITNISIDNTWFTSKTTDGGSFKKTSDNVTLRLDTIKLDYITNGGASFICKDNNGVNILQNLIPSNYAGSGYSLSLGYKTGGSIKSVPWLTARGTLGSILGTTVNFGGALFDSKNGVVTFYDVNGTPSSIFGSAEFYLTATKYIGPKGITSAPSLNVAGSASFDDTTESSNTTSGAVQIAGGLGIAKNTFIGGDASVTNDLNVGGDTTISGNLIVSGTTTTVNANTLDISDNATIDGKLIVKSDISLNGSMNTDGGAIIQGSVGIGTTSAPVKLAIVSTDAIKIPVGTSNQRPTSSGEDHYGYIRYNTDLSSYEGFGDGNVWGSLGGIKDVDGDTYISAENSAGADNDQLKFFTANSQRMIIDSTGDASFNADVNVVGNLRIQQAATITGKLTAQNDASFNQALNVDGVTTLNSTLRVVGDATMDSNATIDGDLLVKSSGIVDNDLLVRRNLTVDGSINFLGEFIQKDTVIQVTEQMDLSNDGTGPALIVRQHGAQPVATFYDDATLSMIIKDGGDVSFNKSVCILEDLSVNGSISVTGGHGGTIAGALITGDDDARPTNPTVGTIRFNTESEKQYAEIYASSWLQITTGEQLTRVDASVNRLYANSDLDPEIITFDDDNFMHIARNGGGPDSVFRLSNDFEVSGNTIFKGDVTLNKMLIIHDDLSLNDHLVVGKTSTFNGKIISQNDISVNGIINVEGNSVFNNNLHIKKDLTVDGSINFTGDFIKTDTIVRITEQMDVSNTGTGPALIVRQYGSEPIATFFDDSNEIMRIANGGVIGIGTNNPTTSDNTKLDVRGSIRANYNSDTTSYFGNAAIGFASHGNHATFAHIDRNENDGNDYAIMQSSAGVTTINAESSKSIEFRLGNSDGTKMIFKNSRLGIGIGQHDPSATLHVSGTSKFVGDASFNSNVSIDGNFNVNQISTFTGKMIAENDISLNGILTVNGVTALKNNLTVTGDASFNTGLSVDGNVNIDGNTVHTGTTLLSNTVTVNAPQNNTGDLTLIGDLLATGDISLNGKLYGTGDASFNTDVSIGGNFNVDQISTFTGKVIAENDISLNGILAVNGDASFNSNIAVNGDIIPMQNEVYDLGSESLRFKDLYLSGSSIQIGTDTIKVENNSFQLKAIDTENNATIGGDISLNGILAVNGDVSFNNKLNVENDATFKSQIHAIGNATFDNNVHIKNELTVDGSINFTGDFIKTDTIVRITEQMDLSNNGTGPALIVRQHGTGSGYHIAEFYDDTSVSTVFKDGGDVSFNESIQIGKNITVQKKIINTGGVIHQF